MAKPVTIYTTEYCPYCMQAKSLLKQKGIPFQEVDLTKDAAKREEVMERTGRMTVPIIFIGEELVGGAEELAQLDASGELDSKLK